MFENLPVLRYNAHRVCAHPMTISWGIGTLLIWIPLSKEFVTSGAFTGFPNDLTMVLLLSLSYVLTSGLGFFLGGFLVLLFVLPICRRLNGAPHEEGERVLILSGKHSKKSGLIYEISIGQGGQPVLRVDLGDEAKKSYEDMYGEESLLRLLPRRRDSESNQNPRQGEQDAAGQSVTTE